MGDRTGGYLLAPSNGDHYAFLGTLATVKAGDAQTGGAFTLIEQVAPPGFRPPPHVREAEWPATPSASTNSTNANAA